MPKFQMHVFVIFFMLLSLTCLRQACAGEDGTLIAQARGMAKQGNFEFAFMNYSRVLREFPLSKFTPEALYGRGEYGFALHDYPLAKENFQILAQRFPKKPQRIFALVYLWKIAHDQSDESAQQELAREIVSFRQVSLIFRKSASYRFRSPLGKEHLAIFKIDKIQVYLQGELFAEIDY